MQKSVHASVESSDHLSCHQPHPSFYPSSPDLESLSQDPGSEPSFHTSPQIEAIHLKALVLSSRYKISESELIEILIEVDQNKVYRAKEFKSLYDYAHRGLKLSENTAYHFITIARKASEVPGWWKKLPKAIYTFLMPEELRRFSQKQIQFKRIKIGSLKRAR